jgi:hypothetical protein
MRNLYILLLPAMLIAFPLTASADSWKDESGRGRGHDRREYKEEYWDGNCKVKRKQKNGEYKEERKCKGPSHGHYEPTPVYAPPSPTVVIDPSGVTVHGTVRIGR